MIKRVLIIVMLFSLLYIFVLATLEVLDFRNEKPLNHYIENTYEETGSKNYVTGIYLDYRLFDSIFEASTLLIAVVGIIFIAKEET